MHWHHLRVQTKCSTSAPRHDMSWRNSSSWSFVLLQLISRWYTGNCRFVRWELGEFVIRSFAIASIRNTGSRRTLVKLPYFSCTVHGIVQTMPSYSRPMLMTSHSSYSAKIVAWEHDSFLITSISTTVTHSLVICRCSNALVGKMQYKGV